jgi:hypothetical protein
MKYIASILLKFRSTLIFHIDLMTTIYVSPSLTFGFLEKALFSHATKPVFTALEKVLKYRYP